MSSNQETFEDFPQDDGLWVVKHIDQFQQAHLKTRSTAVKVMLQRLPPMNNLQFSYMIEKDAQEILGRRRGGPWLQLEFADILVGSLPLISVGFVFKNGVKVGELPRSRHIISLLPGATEPEEVEAGQEVPKPAYWDPKLPHRTLNPSEYAGVVDHNSRNVLFSKSRLVVFTRRSKDGKEVFVIPRTTIFKAFYAQHSEIAKAFCSGPWSHALEKVICLNDLESGLKTESINNGEQWNIVLRTLVPDDYAGLLAVLYFDDYARSRAEMIHARSLQDRNMDPRKPWYASAQIPFQAIHNRLDLAVKCLSLKPSYYTEEDGERRKIQKYLVTEICGSNWPKQYPPIGITRTNDGTGSSNPQAVAEPAPYQKRPETKESDPTTTVNQNHDANANASTTKLGGSEWAWLDQGPVTEKLQKLSSKRYEGKVSAPDDDDGNRVSPGAHTHEKDTLPKAETKTLVRIPNARFEHIVQVLDQLRQAHSISRITEVPPRRPGQLSDRNGRRCWKFIDEESLRHGGRPRAGWRAIYPDPGVRRNANYRTALVLSLEINGDKHYWIEIECRAGDGYRSVLLSDILGDVQGTLETTLDVIAEAKGRDLEEHIQMTFQDGLRVNTYRHHYAEDRKSLTIESIKNFLTKAVGITPEGGEEAA